MTELSVLKKGSVWCSP